MLHHRKAEQKRKQEEGEGSREGASEVRKAVVGLKPILFNLTALYS